MKRAALFLDRDGVINRPPPGDQRYITSPGDFFLMPGIADIIRIFNQAEIPVIVITNQKCIAIGRLTPQGLDDIHERMRVLLRAHGADVNGIYHCPHQESDRCDCRKPRPGMLLRAAKEFHLDPHISWMVGDQPRDCQAAKAAGCGAVIFGSCTCPEADVHCPDMNALKKWSQVFLAKTKETRLQFTEPSA